MTGGNLVSSSKEVAEGRINKSGAMRCESSDRPIVAMTRYESTEEMNRGGNRCIGPGAKSEGTAKGTGSWRSSEPNTGKAVRILIPEGSCGKPVPLSKKVESYSGKGKNAKTPPERGKKKRAKHRREGTR